MIEYFVDKSEFGIGPWDDEPDKVQWTDPTGLTCLAVRHEILGNWCGYVGVPEGHPWYELPYHEVDVDVHGGLSFSSHCRGRICHVADTEVWWLGFDCGHAFDLCPPMMKKYGIYEGCVYRDLVYVQEQCALLAQQIKGKS